MDTNQDKANSAIQHTNVPNWVKPGVQVFIRTVTTYFLGEVESVDPCCINLVKATWVADTGKFSDFLKSGQARELEVCPPDNVHSVMTGGIIDMCAWKHELPTSGV